jgi:branched-chain amino acid transport system substrate-binding protein
MFASDKGRINRASRGAPSERVKKGEGLMHLAIRLGVLSALIVLTWPAVSTAADMRGVTATEIKIGQTMPYSGPVSAFGALGKGEVGYFKMLNERGGINGRKINLISLDDSYAPPKTVEQTRRLVESDEVALIFS